MGGAILRKPIFFNLFIQSKPFIFFAQTNNNHIYTLVPMMSFILVISGAEVTVRVGFKLAGGMDRASFESFTESGKLASSLCSNFLSQLLLQIRHLFF